MDINPQELDFIAHGDKYHRFTVQGFDQLDGSFLKVDAVSKLKVELVLICIRNQRCFDDDIVKNFLCLYIVPIQRAKSGGIKLRVTFDRESC
jgi:hypothetical protein